jgi:hypothetical protein
VEACRGQTHSLITKLRKLRTKKVLYHWSQDGEVVVTSALDADAQAAIRLSPQLNRSKLKSKFGLSIIDARDVLAS